LFFFGLLSLFLLSPLFCLVFGCEIVGEKEWSRKMDEISLPPDFNQIALAQFDGLVKKGKLFYAPPVKEEVVCKSGFKVRLLGFFFSLLRQFSSSLFFPSFSFARPHCCYMLNFLLSHILFHLAFLTLTHPSLSTLYCTALCHC